MYKLIKIKPTGMRVTLEDGTDKDALVTSGKKMQQAHSDLHLGVVDSCGVIVWPSA